MERQSSAVRGFLFAILLVAPVWVFVAWLIARLS